MFLLWLLQKLDISTKIADTESLSNDELKRLYSTAHFPGVSNILIEEVFSEQSIRVVLSSEKKSLPFLYTKN